MDDSINVDPEAVSRFWGKYINLHIEQGVKDKTRPDTQYSRSFVLATRIATRLNPKKEYNIQQLSILNDALTGKFWRV